VQTHLHRVTEPAASDVDIALSLGHPKPPASRPRPKRRADRKSEDLSVFAHDLYDAELLSKSSVSKSSVSDLPDLPDLANLPQF
jgi:hypothetical protein